MNSEGRVCETSLPLGNLRCRRLLVCRPGIGGTWGPEKAERKLALVIEPFEKPGMETVIEGERAFKELQTSMNIEQVNTLLSDQTA